MFKCRLRFPAFLPPSAALFHRILRSCSSVSDEIKSAVESIASDSRRLAGAPRRIELIDSAKDWENIYSTFISELRRFPVLGFDCEWPPTMVNLKEDIDQKLALDYVDESVGILKRKRAKVALIQLATPNGTVVLVRMNRMETIPDSLRDLMADKTMLKVGVESKWDGYYIWRDYPSLFSPVKGTYDVRYILYPDTRMEVRYRSRNKVGRMYSSLSTLCQDYLNIPIEKRFRITCSNWAAPVLSPEQIQYAATDAQLSVDVFFALLKYVGFDILHDDWQNIYEYCLPRLDEAFRVGIKQPMPLFFPKPGNEASQSTDSMENEDRDRSSTVSVTDKT